MKRKSLCLGFAIAALACFLFWGGRAYAQIEMLQDEGVRSVQGKVVENGRPPGIEITSHSGEWSAFFSMGGGSLPIFLIHGELHNISGKELTYVKLQYELVGEDGVVVYRDYGYNRRAEILRDEAYESGKKSLAEMGVKGIPSGGKDSFRFPFFKDDVPEFQSYRIRILEAK